MPFHTSNFPLFIEINVTQAAKVQINKVVEFENTYHHIGVQADGAGGWAMDIHSDGCIFELSNVQLAPYCCPFLPPPKLVEEIAPLFPGPDYPIDP